MFKNIVLEVLSTLYILTKLMQMKKTSFAKNSLNLDWHLTANGGDDAKRLAQVKKTDR